MAVDIAIDMGTSRTRIFLPQKGIVTDEPSAVAIRAGRETVMAVGNNAYRMMGRTANHIKVIFPLNGGVITHYTLASAMLSERLQRIYAALIRMPKIAVQVPVGITDVERRAMIQAVSRMGVRQLQVVESPIAAALRLGLDISRPHGILLVDIGGGITDMAVITLGGTAVSRSVRQGGNAMDDAIMDYVREQHRLLIGRRTAEEAKRHIGCVVSGTRTGTYIVKGKNVLTGQPDKAVLRAEEMPAVLRATAQTIADSIKSLLTEVPPELSADIAQDGIILTGGGALLAGMDRFISQTVGWPAQSRYGMNRFRVRRFNLTSKDSPSSADGGINHSLRRVFE